MTVKIQSRFNYLEKALTEKKWEDIYVSKVGDGVKAEPVSVGVVHCSEGRFADTILESLYNLNLSLCPESKKIIPSKRLERDLKKPTNLDNLLIETPGILVIRYAPSFKAFYSSFTGGSGFDCDIYDFNREKDSLQSYELFGVIGASISRSLRTLSNIRITPQRINCMILGEMMQGIFEKEQDRMRKIPPESRKPFKR